MSEKTEPFLITLVGGSSAIQRPSLRRQSSCERRSLSLNMTTKRSTFGCDDSTIITISVRGVRDGPDGEILPENFRCVFRDTYKVFVRRGRPQPLGVVQAIVGILILGVGMMALRDLLSSLHTLAFVISGLLNIVAGQVPDMRLLKLSFSGNAICLAWSVAGVIICIQKILRTFQPQRGLLMLLVGLLVVEVFLSVHLMFWASRAVCRRHFNTLPVVQLKHVR